MDQDQLLQKAFGFADAMKVYKAEYRDLVASVVQFNDQLESDEEWYNQLLDIHDSLLAWHQLDSLSSFLQSEDIASMLSYYRVKLAEKCPTSGCIQPSHAPMDISSVLPALRDILREADAVRALNQLHNLEAHKATILLRRCLDAMPVDSPDSLATQAILGNLQPLDTYLLRHGTISESQELNQLCYEIPYSLEPARRPLSRQPPAAQSIETVVANPTLPSVLRIETLPPIDEGLSFSTIPSLNARTSSDQLLHCRPRDVITFQTPKLEKRLYKFLLSSYVQAGDILRTSRKMEWFSLQAIHIASQAFHLIILFNNFIGPNGPTDEQYDEGMELDDALEELEDKIDELVDLELDEAIRSEVNHKYDLEQLYRVFFSTRDCYPNGRDFTTDPVFKSLVASDHATLILACRTQARRPHVKGLKNIGVHNVHQDGSGNQGYISGPGASQAEPDNTESMTLSALPPRERRVLVAPPASGIAPTPATSIRSLEFDSLDAAIFAVTPVCDQTAIETVQPLLFPAPVNSPPDDDPDANSRGPSPIITTPLIDFSTCRVRLQMLVEDEEIFLHDNWDAEFATSLRNANPPLVPLSLVDGLIGSMFGTFLQIRTAHSLALATVKPLTEDFSDLGSLETLFLLTGDIMARFGSLYPEYAQGLKNLHTIVENATEVHQGFRVWMEADDHADRLYAFLRRPFQQLEGYFSALHEIVEVIEGESGNRYTYEIRKRLKEWESLICQTRLWGWQSAMGHDPLFDRGFEELTSISNDPTERNGVRLARQRAKFKVVELQMFFVDMLKGLSKGVWTWLSTVSNPPSEEFTGLLDALNMLLHHHTVLLVELHGQQRLHYPQMARLLSTLDQLSRSWSNPYHQYCQILTECLSEIHSFHLDNLIFLPDTTQPRLHGKDLLTLLRAPLLHLRHLNRALRSLMDATPDDHLEIECLVDILSTLGTLADQCQGYNCWTGVNLHLQELIMQLVWTEADARDFGIEEPWRKLFETGWLFLPRTISTPHGPGGAEMGPHGTSEYSELLDVFVVILDNCVFVAKSISRWGVKRLVVLKAIRLNTLDVVDPALSDPSGARLYLLDGYEGKRVVAPLEILDKSKGETLTLYAPTTAIASSWRERLLSAKLAPNESLRQSSRLFRTNKIADLDSYPQCSTMIFVKEKKYLLFGGGFGHPSGVWMVTQDEPRTLVIAGYTLKQCAVIESLGVILMLLGKGLYYNLYAYKVEDLVSPGPQNLDQPRDTIRSNVTFFRVGYHHYQPFLVIITEETRTTHIHWYIPPAQTTGSWRRNLFTKDGGTLFQRVGKYVTNVRVWDVDILPDNEGLVLMGESGFQLIKMDKSNSFEMTNLPQLPDHASSHVAQRCRTTKPIGIVKVDSEFLLCYSDFGIYATPQGRIYGRAVDWETSQRMTHVSFLPPYFLLVSGTSIEIRLIKDGRHVQTIEGNNVRLTRPLGEVRGSGKEHDSRTRRDDIRRMHVVLEDPPDDRSKVELLELEIPMIDVSSP